MRDSEKSRPNWEKGNEVLGLYLAGKIAGSDKVTIALKACNIHRGMLAAENGRDTNVLQLAKVIASNPEERRKYIEKSMPMMIGDKK